MFYFAFGAEASLIRTISSTRSADQPAARRRRDAAAGDERPRSPGRGLTCRRGGTAPRRTGSCAASCCSGSRAGRCGSSNSEACGRECLSSNPCVTRGVGGADGTWPHGLRRDRPGTGAENPEETPLRTPDCERGVQEAAYPDDSASVDPYPLRARGRRRGGVSAGRDSTRRVYRRRSIARTRWLTFTVFTPVTPSCELRPAGLPETG